MPDVAVPSAARVVHTILQSNGDIGVNVMHFSTANDGLTAGQMSALADLVNTEWVSIRKGVSASADKLVNLRVQDLNSVPYPTIDFPQSSVGTDSGTELPKQIAACISLQTAHPGRSGKGRMFIGSVTETAITTGGALTSTYKTALHDYAAALIVGSTSGDATFKLAVYSRKDGLLYECVAALIDSRADVQRRRANRRLF